METINVLAILPYPGLKELLIQAVEEHDNLNVDIFVGDMQEGVNILKNVSDKDYDVIISRGGTAELIEKETEIPVIYLEISGYDMLRIFKLIQNYTGKLAVVGFSKILESVTTLCDLLRYDIDKFELKTQNDVYPILEELKEKGYNFVVGDVITTKAAETMGLNYALLTSGKESIEKALKEAIKLCRQLSKSVKEKEIYKRVLEHEVIYLEVYGADGERIYSNQKLDLFHQVLKSGNLYNYFEKVDYNQKINFHKSIDGEIWNIMGEQVSLTQDKEGYLFYGRKRLDIKSIEEEVITLDNKKQRQQIRLSSFESSNDTMKKAIQQAEKSSKNRRALLISGEKGTGKDEIALAIHRERPKNDKVFIKFDCSRLNKNNRDQIYENLTKIIIDQKDFTLFFEKINELPLEFHQDLLILLNQFEKIPGSMFISATTESIPVLIEKNRFSIELYEKLGRESIYLPSLRERSEDINNLCSLFIGEINVKYGKEVIGIDEDGILLLKHYRWNYNVKQLRHVLESLVLNSKSSYLSAFQISTVLKQESALSEVKKQDSYYNINVDRYLDDITKEIIEIVLNEEHLNQSKTAKRLGISRSTLWRKIN
ncbi:sigma-54-dependent Fis family transcriptional regulator [Acetobacterium bakii]|uniref:Sigma-54 factor interaction domain-containing protein n=1 Tax=Acetobacterium bakii TaxID=52689 RepID=A0A0L6TX54_9FIRM|nr:sigma-54-dependent transcriptional regulator [Acetobacterium bakii]KNZ40165.1 hypothetical protein AKG39_19120 [Acetobacterium bakii]